MTPARVALLALAGCVTNAPVTVPSLDAEVFAERVQPVLAARCASPACHGSDRRRLRVYSQGFLRIDPRRTHLDEPLSPAEVTANLRSAEAFALDAPSAAESLLIAKPTARVTHLGGRVFSDDDGDAVTLTLWLRSGGAP